MLGVWAWGWSHFLELSAQSLILSILTNYESLYRQLPTKFLV